MKKAWVVLIVTIIFSVVAGFFRRQALLFGFNAEGLTEPFYAHKVTAVISIVFLCLLFCTVMSQRVLKNGSAYVYVASGAPALVLELVASAAVVLGGVLFLIHGGLALSFATVLGVFAIIGGLCLALFVIMASRNELFRGSIGILIVTLFAAFWLIYTFKLNGANPAIAYFAYKILGVVCLCLACYFTGGFCVGLPKPRPAGFFYMSALYFLILSLLNPCNWGEFIITLGFILFIACRGYCVVRNSFWAVDD
ncbi:MAG: hypothetical protein IJP23_02505 [Oscillospiraceae bacterium]|nr:hypothetical protein [Oscillospiraceae bacterium]